MRRIAVVTAAVIGCGCGRLGFSERTPSDAADGAAGDTGGAPGDTRGAAGGSAMLVQALGPGLVQAPTLNIPITHGSGDLLIAGVYWNQTATAIAVSDALGAEWMSLPPQVVPSGCDACGASNAQIYYTTANAAGADTITVSQQSQSCPLGMFVLDYTGLSGSGVVDVGATAEVASNTAATPPLTMTGDAVIVDVIANGHGVGTIVPGPGFDLAVADYVFNAGLEVSSVTAGTYTPTAMLPGGAGDRCWATAAAAFPL